MERWLLLVLTFLAALTSCGKKNSTLEERIRAQELHLSLSSEPPTLDPRKAVDTTSLAIIRLCFEGLMELNQAGDPIPALAERVEVSLDQKTYTFFLKESFWSDGVQVTANDFEHTWKTLLSPLFPCPYASDLYVIKNAQAAKLGSCSVDEVGVVALDAKTLVVHLDHPIPYFLSLVGSRSFPAVPKHITENNPSWAENEGPQFICNGPFQLEGWRHNVQIDLIKNKTYWDAQKIRLEKIHLALIEDEQTNLSLFENGDLDWIGSPVSSIPLDATESLKKQGSLEIFPVPGLYSYLFNTKQYPFNNVHIRRALSLAINRKAIVDNIMQNDQIPALAMIPPSMWQHPEQYFQDADVTKARQELQKGLDELGTTLDQLAPLRLCYNTLSGHHKIAQAIQGQWLEALGIKVELSNKEWKVFLDELRHHQFGIARMGGVASYNDPMNFFELYRYLSSSDNYTQWTNPHFTELLELSDRTSDPEKRVALLKEAEKIFMEEMPVAPIYFYTGCYLKKNYVHGAQINAIGSIDFKYAYLEMP
ncbi:MAG: peptide ABC transporter substrate-binding protein [Rhabdochlamydiaceae bacterium]|nr:peptide ABC transporter substrate-binding protein [Rhabdochlamydiaceae bacterium]